MGFQKTPLLSRATWVQPCCLSQSRRRSKSGVIVLKVRRSLCCCPCSGKRRQATTVLYVLRNRIYSKERPFFRISRSFLINTTDILSVYSEESCERQFRNSVD